MAATLSRPELPDGTFGPPAWVPYAWTRLLSQELVAGIAGRTRILVVEAPVQHGKSTLCSHWFPTWVFCLRPQYRVGVVSYEANVARRWGRRVRNSLQEHQDSIGVAIAADTSAQNEWETNEGGGMVTAGIGGPLTGRPLEVLIIDDPIKNAKEAASKTTRDDHEDWLDSVAETRIQEGGFVVLVMSRWHKDDLAGRIKKKADAGKISGVRVLTLPALAESADDPLGREIGEPLEPKRFSQGHLERRRRSMTARYWLGLYQGRPPTDDENALWTWAMIEHAEKLWSSWFASTQRYPEFSQIAVAVDPASTSTETSDDTGIMVVGKWQQVERYSVLDDATISQARPNEWGGRVLDMVQKWSKHRDARVVYESNQGGDMVRHVIETAARARGVRVRIKGVHASRGKQVRAEPISAMYEQGLVDHAGELGALNEELTGWVPEDPVSPNRLDALVWALTDLGVKQRGKANFGN